MTRILIADDHPLFRLALAQTARDAVAGAVVDEAATLDEAKARLAAHPDTDLVLLDLHMPGSHGLMGLAALRAAHPAVAVAMISAHDDPATVRRALAHGACAYIPKRLGLDPLPGTPLDPEPALPLVGERLDDLVAAPLRVLPDHVRLVLRGVLLVLRGHADVLRGRRRHRGGRRRGRGGSGRMHAGPSEVGAGVTDAL